MSWPGKDEYVLWNAPVPFKTLYPPIIFVPAQVVVYGEEAVARALEVNQANASVSNAAPLFSKSTS